MNLPGNELALVWMCNEVEWTEEWKQEWGRRHENGDPSRP